MAERDTGVSMRARAIAACAVALVFVALGLSDAWRRLELKGFDALTVATAANASAFPITVVGIDEPSFAQLKLQWPWPRSMHARLLDALTKAGAAVVAFDMQLSEPDRNGPHEDTAFANAIRAHGNVVLASDLQYVETEHARQWKRVDPIDAFRAAGAASGFARVPIDRDQVARGMPYREADAFWRQIALGLLRLHPEIRIEEPRPGAMIRYAGPIFTFQYVPYHQALDPSKLPPDLFKDQVVIVGWHVEASPNADTRPSDVFNTPFTGTNGMFTPGAELHANILETALRGDAIYPVGGPAGAAFVAFLVFAAASLMFRWRPIVSAAIGLALIAAIVLLDWVLFTRFNLWLGTAAAAAAGVAGTYLAYGALAFLQEQRRRAELRRAFGLYVSPEVVDHVMANRDRLALGGERRDITVMFTDLEGFTTLTERLGAEQVAKILNLHFTGATRIVKQHGGTVNRFIGDAVMAMWGAPLDDPHQARNAVTAACEMQADLARLRDELVAQGLPPIRMRVGLHSCNAIVGNLGSDDRFDYTAIGDGVNLGARLEGVNKLYGTGILASGDTVARMAGQPRMRLIDEVIVKGKSQPVEIFTPSEDAELIALTLEAIEAYRARRWDESDMLWRRIATRWQSDGVAAVYLQRLERLRSRPVEAAAWRSAVELEKL
jgi:adenylate cyclase